MDWTAWTEWALAHAETIAAAVSALVAVIAAVFARKERRAQQRLARETLRERIDQASLDWGAETIDLFAESSALALKLARGEAEAGAREALAVRLTAAADKGRMFFPNTDPDAKGAGKLSAFKGDRQPVLDAVIFVHDAVCALGEPGALEGAEAARFITDCRRLLVSELQAHLDPRRRDEVVDRYRGRGAAAREEAKARAKALWSRRTGRPVEEFPAP